MAFGDRWSQRGDTGSSFTDRWGGSRYQQVLDQGSNLITSPETVAGLAAYGATPTEVQAVAGAAEAQRLLTWIGNLPDGEEATVYRTLTPVQKEMLRLANYRPPEVKEQQGLLRRTFGNIPYLSDAVENTLSTAGKPLAPVLDAFNAAENFKDRLVRTAMRVNDYQITTEQEGGGSPFSLGMWARAWRDVEDGEASYDLGEYDAIHRRHGERVMLAAYNLSKGETPEEVMRFLLAQGYTTQQAADLTFGQQTAQAVAELETAKLSIGRLVGDLLGDPEVSVFGRKVHLTSGFVDGLDAILLDPTLIGSKATAAVKAARWGVRGADIHRLDALMRTDEAARGWNRVGGQLETIRNAEDAADRARAFDRLAHEGLVPQRMVQPLLDAGVRDVDTAREWMVNARNALSIVSGTRAQQLLPGRLTRRGEALLNSKAALRERIDWALDGPRLVALSTGSATYDPRLAAEARAAQLRRRRGLLTPEARRTRLGLGVRRITTKVPEVEKLRLSHPESAFQVHRAAMMTGMPKYWADEVAGAYLAAGHAGRRQIEKGMLDTVLELAANGSDSLRAWAAQHTDDANDLATNRAYGIGGRDVKVVNGVRKHLAVTDGQMTDAVSMPSFTDVNAHSARMGILDRLGAATHADAVETYMARAFRPGVLLRPALAVRNFGEEVLSHVMRAGAADYTRARAALTATRTPEGRLFRTLTSDLDPADVDRLLNQPTAENLTRATLAARLKQLAVVPGKGKRAAARLLAGDEMAGYLDEIAATPTAQRALARSAVLNTERGGMGYVQQEKETLRKVKRGGKHVVVSLTEAGSYRQRPTAGLDGATRLHRQLVDLNESKVTRAALDLWDDPQAPERLADFILSDDFRVERAMSERMLVTTAPGLSPQAAERAAALDWANVVLGHVRDHVTDADGNIVDDLLTPLRRGEVPSVSAIDALPNKPPQAVGKDVLLLADGQGLLQSVTQYGFGKIGEWVDWAARQPILVANYATARRAQSGVEAALVEQMGETAAKRLLTESAMDTAIADTLRFVDNPDVRSQAAVILRNVVPFWRAQEEFYVRWATTLVHSPEAIRKAQLLMHGMRHSGFVQRDNQGRDYFNYPAPGFVRDALARVFGAPDLGVAHPLRGQVVYLNQGLDPRGVVPNVGPLVSIPLNLLAEAIPETGGVTAAIVGERGAGQSPLDAVTPTLVRRAWDVLGQDTEQRASARLQFIQAAAAADPDGSKGLFLRPDASPSERQAFNQRADRWARSIGALRFFYGLAAPASPQSADLAPASAVQVDGLHSVSDEFRAMLNSGAPFEEAVAAFIARHPDGSPWTVSKTEATVTGHLPATAKAADWLRDNRVLAQTYRQLVPFLIPADPGDFDPNAFRLELAYGLRQRKSDEQFYTDIALSGVLGLYHDSKDRKDAALENAMAAGQRALAAEIRRTWSLYRGDLLARNPLLAEHLAAGSTRQQDRESIITDWKNAQVEGALPDTPGARAIAAMVAARDTWTATMTGVLGRRDDAAERYRSVVTGTYLDYQRKIAAQDPAAHAFYVRVIAPLDEE